MKENPQVFKKKSSKNKNSTGLLSITTLQKTVLILSDQNGSSLLGQKIPHEKVSWLQTPDWWQICHRGSESWGNSTSGACSWPHERGHSGGSASSSPAVFLGTVSRQEWRGLGSVWSSGHHQSLPPRPLQWTLPGSSDQGIPRPLLLLPHRSGLLFSFGSSLSERLKPWSDTKYTTFWSFHAKLFKYTTFWSLHAKLFLLQFMRYYLERLFLRLFSDKCSVSSA